jgi:hypothetical protein
MPHIGRTGLPSQAGSGCSSWKLVLSADAMLLQLAGSILSLISALDETQLLQRATVVHLDSHE